MKIRLLVDSLYAQLSMGLTSIGFWMFIVGFFTDFWYSGPFITAEFAGFKLKGHSGLWKGCDETGTLCYRPKGDGELVWFLAFYLKNVSPVLPKYRNGPMSRGAKY